ncbi:hypothetical protein Lal_00028973 [Lupinus albus]|uniref:Uncharacterized protein n=1 Tax=Lupinus albus TaxID=3870 RepID=A0A6A4NWL5_LUPAL|nr:putative protein jagunal [Lupinus albus]KAF1885084.1 hypothetical protein Lal_00028973 [Lupinus albus]
MKERKSGTLGRPSGTDGSDYSYRMVVDSRYQLVAKWKKHLSLLFIIQGVFVLIGVIIAIVSATQNNNLNTIAFSSLIVTALSLLIAEIGRRRSRATLLRFYVVVSSIAIFLFIASLAMQYSLHQAIKDFSFGKTTKFDAAHFSGFQAGLLLYLFTLSVFNIYTVRAVLSLLFNMSPPKKAS